MMDKQSHGKIVALMGNAAQKAVGNTVMDVTRQAAEAAPSFTDLASAGLFIGSRAVAGALAPLAWIVSAESQDPRVIVKLEGDKDNGRLGHGVTEDMMLFAALYAVAMENITPEGRFRNKTEKGFPKVAFARAEENFLKLQGYKFESIFDGLKRVGFPPEASPSVQPEI